MLDGFEGAKFDQKKDPWKIKIENLTFDSSS